MMPVPPAQSQANSAPRSPVLFLPGLLNDGRLFSSQIAALQAKGYSCQGVKLDFADTIEGLAQGILVQGVLTQNALVQAPQGYASRFSLVALSMGGYVAFEMIRQLQAAGQADRLERLVLLNTQARPDSDETRKQREGLIRLAQLGRFKGVTPRLLPRLLGPAALADTQITGLIMQMAEETGREGYVSQQRAILSRPDSRTLLPTIAVPTLVIGGTEDKLTPPEVMREMADAIPNAQLRILEGCGHLSALEQAGAVTDLITDFFAMS